MLGGSSVQSLLLVGLGWLKMVGWIDYGGVFKDRKNGLRRKKAFWMRSFHAAALSARVGWE